MTKREVIALLRKRAKLASELISMEALIREYIMEHDLQNKVDEYDWMMGVEVFGNPTSSGSVESVIKVINNN